MAGNYQKLEVWKKSMDLAVQVYSLAKKLPKEETYALADQVRRAAVSIPSNIAEGQSRGDKGFMHFLKVAKGSCAELETQLLLCIRLKYLNDSDVAFSLAELDEIGKMLSSLVKYLKSKLSQ